MKLLIADDEKIITDLVSDSLIDTGKLVTVTNDSNNVLDLVNSNDFDLVLLDMFFPNQEGIDILIDIKKTNSNLPVMFMSSNFNPNLIRRAFDKGAIGYITKSAGKEELHKAIDIVTAGGKYVCEATTKLLLKDAMNDDISEMSLKDKLTPREIDVLKLVAEGLTANEIAEVLFISVKTVETHKSNMMEKFETNKIIKLVKIAFENNII
jgi:DNA-binding NarL/FixJ family response regulator